MPTATDWPVYVPQASENAVPVEEVSRVPLPTRKPPSIRDEIVRERMRSLFGLLDTNTLDVQEEGGRALQPEARNFIMRLALEVLISAVGNPTSSSEDFRLTPFARPDGGAYLLVDFGPTEKRLTFQVAAEANQARVAMTSSPRPTTGDIILTPDDAGRFLGWLTSKRL